MDKFQIKKVEHIPFSQNTEFREEQAVFYGIKDCNKIYSKI